jgi:CRP-like cAMP-binding protein
MATKATRLQIQKSRKGQNSDGDGNHIHNRILLELPQREQDLIVPKLEFVRLTTQQILHEVGDSLKSGYFCDTGMVSILSVFPDGKSVEVGLAGPESFIGLPMIAGFRTSASRAVVQIEATAFRVDADALTSLLPECPTLDQKLQQRSQILAMEVMHIAACNRVHDVEERLARWLLMCADRVSDESLPLTQELLAQMLGTRRSSVTIAAGVLQKAGLIAYTRGHVKIVNRQSLEDAACECYHLMEAQLKTWLGDSDEPAKG